MTHTYKLADFIRIGFDVDEDRIEELVEALQGDFNFKEDEKHSIKEWYELIRIGFSKEGQTVYYKVNVRKMTPESKLPAYGREGDACLDCYADKEVVIPKLTLENGVGRALVPLGFALELPKGWEALVRSRSGLALKEGVVVLNSPGTVDENYRGEVAAIMGNTSGKDYVVKKGERICQLAIRPILYNDIGSRLSVNTVGKSIAVRWNEVDELSETNRGAGGFGSSGKE